MSSEPNNPQALDLKSKIEKSLQMVNFDNNVRASVLLFYVDGVLGLAVVGGLAAAAAGIMLVMFRPRRK